MDESRDESKENSERYPGEESVKVFLEINPREESGNGLQMESRREIQESFPREKFKEDSRENPEMNLGEVFVREVSERNPREESKKGFLDRNP